MENNGDILWSYDTGYYTHYPPLAEDITGDNIPEIVATSDFEVFAWDAQGVVITGFPITIETNAYGTCSVADIDNDSDGIIDSLDECPDEPETLNGINDSDGCPDQTTGTPESLSLNAYDIFHPNSAKIKIDGKNYLDKIISLLTATSGKTWRIEGHMDNKGSEKFLRTLSLERAKAVLEYLVLFGGLNREDFQVYGMGDKFPVADNSTEEGRRRNRRIEIKLED